MQFPRLEIMSSSIRAESRDYKETTTTTTTTTRRRRRRRKGGEKKEKRIGMDGLAMGRERWNGFSGKIQRDILFAPSWRDAISLARHAIFLPSVPFSTAFHLPRATVPLTLCNWRGGSFSPLYSSIYSEIPLPLETSVTRDIPSTLFFLSFPFFFFSSIRSNYVSRDLPLSLSVSGGRAIKGKRKHLELFTPLALKKKKKKRNGT